MSIKYWCTDVNSDPVLYYSVCSTFNL